MSKKLITLKEKQLFKKYLTVEDYKIIENETPVKRHTVQNIINRQTGITERNKPVLDYLYIQTYKRMKEEKEFIKKNFNKVKNIDAVRCYINDNEQSGKFYCANKAWCGISKGRICYKEKCEDWSGNK